MVRWLGSPAGYGRWRADGGGLRGAVANGAALLQVHSRRSRTVRQNGPPRGPPCRGRRRERAHTRNHTRLIPDLKTPPTTSPEPVPRFLAGGVAAFLLSANISRASRRAPRDAAALLPKRLKRLVFCRHACLGFPCFSIVSFRSSLLYARMGQFEITARAQMRCKECASCHRFRGRREISGDMRPPSLCIEVQDVQSE